MVRDQRPDVDAPAGNEFDGTLHAFVLAAHVEDAQLVPAQQIDVEAHAINFGNTDYQQCAAGLQEFEALVERILLTRAFKHCVQAQGFEALDGRHHVFAAGLPVQVAPHARATARRSSTRSVT